MNHISLSPLSKPSGRPGQTRTDVVSDVTVLRTAAFAARHTGLYGWFEENRTLIPGATIPCPDHWTTNHITGAGGVVRTRGLLTPDQALFRLSYTHTLASGTGFEPVIADSKPAVFPFTPPACLAAPADFALVACGATLVIVVGLEPTANGLKVRYSTG